MKKQLILSAAAFLMLGAVPAMAADQSYHATTDVSADKNGDYTATTKEKGTDAAGTSEEATKKEKVDTGLSGNVTTKTTATDVVDPKGQMKRWHYQPQKKPRGNGI